jgi:hypothetical protein
VRSGADRCARCRAGSRRCGRPCPDRLRRGTRLALLGNRRLHFQLLAILWKRKALSQPAGSPVRTRFPGSWWAPATAQLRSPRQGSAADVRERDSNYRSLGHG